MRQLYSLRNLLTALCGLGLLLAVSLHSHLPAYLAIAFGGYFAVQEAWSALRHRELDVNLLMLLAAIGSVAVGRPVEAAGLLFLFSLSNALESMAMAKTESAIEALVRLRPASAIRVRNGADEVVPTATLQVEDVVKVPPFSLVPADGVVMEGYQGAVDESAMTGESMPVHRVPGARLLEGTMNQDSLLLMQVTAPVGHSVLDKILELVREAQQNKASGERISSWFGQRYTLFVIAAFFGSFLIRWLVGAPPAEALFVSLVLMVALSPCALVISSPATTLSALAFAARRGILVRGGQYVEAAGKVRMVAFDKTGTLTRGRPAVVEVCVGSGWMSAAPAACSPSMSRTALCGAECAACTCITCWHAGEAPAEDTREALRAAASAERNSPHPISLAIGEAANALGIEAPEAQDVQVIQGLGIRAKVDGSALKIGQRRFFDDEPLPGGFREHVHEMEQRGLTAVLMRYSDRWAAIGLRDEPRESAREAIDMLHAAGIERIALLTGDNPQTAATVAGGLSIDEVHAGLMPQEKEALIADWERQGISVMMVGDGINDGPSLARASIGVAMGALGSDVALKASDVVLIEDRLDRLPLLIRLGRMANRVILANLIFAAAVVLGLTSASIFWKLSLPWAVLGHEGSTVLVILNGLRLLNGPGASIRA